MIKAKTDQDLHGVVTLDLLVEFLHEHLKPYEDTPEDIRRGLVDALGGIPGKDGFVLLALEDEGLCGALVVLGTGMKGYVPGFILLFVAVHKDRRGRGIGGELVRFALAETGGDICLHVEYDNPAKRLYERIGFRSKYAEMRFSS